MPWTPAAKEPRAPVRRTHSSAAGRPKPGRVFSSSSCSLQPSRPGVDEEVDVVAQSRINGAVQVQPHNTAVLRVPRSRWAAPTEQCAKGVDRRLPQIDPRPGRPDAEHDLECHGSGRNRPCAAECARLMPKNDVEPCRLVPLTDTNGRPNAFVRWRTAGHPGSGRDRADPEDQCRAAARRRERRRAPSVDATSGAASRSNSPR